MNFDLCLGLGGHTAWLEVGDRKEFAYTADAEGLVVVGHQELDPLHKGSQLVGTGSVGKD